MRQNSESGFSYIDVLIAITILSIGVLALLAGITSSIVQAKGQEQQTLAKQVASSTIESIMAVKETDPNRMGWLAVGNVGSNVDQNGVAHGIFVTGFQPVYVDAGADEVLGTADDTGTTVPLISRQIVITDLCDPDRPSPACTPPGTARTRFRSVAVTIRYTIGGLQRDEIVQTVLTDYTTD